MPAAFGRGRVQLHLREVEPVGLVVLLEDDEQRRIRQRTRPLVQRLAAEIRGEVPGHGALALADIHRLQVAERRQLAQVVVDAQRERGGIDGAAQHRAVFAHARDISRGVVNL